jgi:hypothetical protein
MLFIAIGKRVTEYGVTEQRFFLIVLGGLLFGLAGYFIFSGRKKIKVIPISLFTVALLTLWGPWSAYNFSLRSQKSRAEKILEKNGLLTGNTTRRATATVSHEDESDLSSIFDYIIRNHGDAAIAEWFPQITITALGYNNCCSSSLKPRSQTAQALMEHLGLKYRRHNPRNLEFFVQSDISENPFSSRGYDNAILINLSPYQTWKKLPFKGKQLSIGVEEHNPKLIILENSKELVSISLAELIKNLRKVDRSADPTTEQFLPIDLLSIEGGNEQLKIKLVIRNLRGEFSDESPSIQYLEGIVFLK